MDRKETGEDFNLDRDLSVTLKSSSPHQTSGWNDPYRKQKLGLVFSGIGLRS